MKKGNSMKKKVSYIEQMEHSECGLACIAMILSYYHHHISLSELRDEFGVPKGGGTFLSLVSDCTKERTEGKRDLGATLLP